MLHLHNFKQEKKLRQSKLHWLDLKDFSTYNTLPVIAMYTQAESQF